MPLLDPPVSGPRLWPVLSGIIMFGASTVDVFAKVEDGVSPGGALGFSCKAGKQYELNEPEAGGGKLDLTNLRGHYTPGNATGTFYPNVRPFRPFTLTGTYSTVTYPIFSGFVERFPLTFDGKYGYTKTRLVDGFAKLSQTVLPSAADSECRLDNPTYLYRLDEPSGSLGAGDSINPGVNPPAVRVDGKYGALSADFGTATGLVDGATGVNFGNSTANVTTVSILAIANGVHRGPLLPANATHSQECWFVGPTSTLMALI